MYLDPTIIRTRTATRLVKLLLSCRDYIEKRFHIDKKEVDFLIEQINKVQEIHEKETKGK